ncbi:hypothetical protein [Streptomyces griseosporeus]|uniref:hypothetical protein n=1 Tax=Streptomyces griseosporeus TaxID=1910 RepID=UPI0036F501B4
MPTFNALVDDFNDGTLDSALWSGSYGDPTESGGRAHIPCTTGYAGLKSASIYTLTGSGITIRLYPPTPAGATSAAASVLVLSSTGGTDGGFIVDPAQSAVGLYLREGYADPAAVFLTYDPAAHAWLRFREAGGTLYWETSPDGIAWTTQRTATTPAWAAGTDLAFLIEGHRDAGTNDTIDVDSVNVPPVATVTGSATLTSHAGLQSAGSRTARAAATLAAASTATASGARTATGSCTATARAQLAATGARRATAHAAPAAAAGLTATATRTTKGSAAAAARATMRVAEAAIDLTVTVGAPQLRWEVGPAWL